MNYNRFKSRKFWVGLLAALAPVINVIADEPLSEKSLALIIGALVAYILGESGVDMARMKNIK